MHAIARIRLIPLAAALAVSGCKPAAEQPAPVAGAQPAQPGAPPVAGAAAADSPEARAELIRKRIEERRRQMREEAERNRGNQ